jgi:Uma2 family endonuclease
MVAALESRRRHFTASEYLELERRAEFKSEYLDGQIYAMAGASPRHNTIVVNTTAELVMQLKGRPCRAFGSDMKVRIPDGQLYSYPDLTVVCGEPLYHDEHGDVLLNPKVLFEVLSPSTEEYDRQTKFDRYDRIETFTDYVLISQSAPRVEHFSRAAEGKWVRIVAAGMDAVLPLASIECVLRLKDVYDRIDFETPKDGETTL